MTRTVIQLRVSAEDREAIRRRARAAGLSVSEYLRRVGVGEQRAKPEPRPRATPKSGLAERVRHYMGRGFSRDYAEQQARLEGYE